MAVDRALRYEQPHSDLLVAQPLGAQPCDIGLTLPKHSPARAVRSRHSRNLRSWLAKRESDCFIADCRPGRGWGFGTHRVGREPHAKALKVTPVIDRRYDLSQVPDAL